MRLEKRNAYRRQRSTVAMSSREKGTPFALASCMMMRAGTWTFALVANLALMGAGCSDDGTTGGTPMTVDSGSDARADAADAANIGADASDAADLGDEDRSADGHVADAPLDRLEDALMCDGSMQFLAYNQPGCGAQTPAPYCEGPAIDPCVSTVCLCNGVTGGDGCHYSTKPFASWGPCPDGGPSDVSSDETSDVTSDVDEDRSTEDHVSDVPADRLQDALMCNGPMQLVVYKQPGCGDQTPPPYCQTLPDDACLSIVCLCSGTTGGDGCGWSTKPFASWGPCPDGATTDASVDR